MTISKHGVSPEELQSVSTPDRVESRLGVLEFDDGAPSEATAALLYDNLDFMNGVHASLFLTANCDTDGSISFRRYDEDGRALA